MRYNGETLRFSQEEWNEACHYLPGLPFDSMTGIYLVLVQNYSVCEALKGIQSLKMTPRFFRDVCAGAYYRYHSNRPLVWNIE